MGVMEKFLAARSQAGQDQTRQLQSLGLLSQLQQHAQEQEMLPLKRQQLELAVRRAKQNADLMSQIQGGMLGGQPMGALSGAPPSGMLGGNKGMLDAPALVQAMLLSGDPGMAKYAGAFLDQNKPIAAREGAPIVNPVTGEVKFFSPKLEPGMVPNFQGNQLTGVSNAPGYIDSMTARDRAREGVKAEFDPLSVPRSDGSTQMMPRSQFLNQQRPQAPAAPMTEQQIIAAGIDATNRGRPFSVSLPPQTSPSGPIPTSAVVGVSQSPADKVRSEGLARTEVERAAAEPQNRLGSTTQLEDLGRLQALANEIMKDPNLARSVGLMSVAPSIPGGPAANVDALIDSLKAQVSGMKLQAMRDASKTGGAVGQVTEKEWPRLENMITALDKKMSPPKFRQKLSELVYEIEKAKRNIAQAYEGTHGQTVSPQPAAQEVKPNMSDDDLIRQYLKNK